MLRDEAVIEAEEAKAAAAKIHLGSLFRIQLLLADGGRELVYDPPHSDYQVRGLGTVTLVAIEVGV